MIKHIIKNNKLNNTQLAYIGLASPLTQSSTLNHLS